MSNFTPSGGVPEEPALLCGGEGVFGGKKDRLNTGIVFFSNLHFKFTIIIL
jgi:hypothetical protein